MEDNKTMEDNTLETAKTVNNNAGLITDLKALTAYLESRPNLSEIYTGYLAIPIYTGSKKEFIRAVRSMGSGEKEYADDLIYFKRMFGAIKLYVCGDRGEVCQRVQVGVKTVKSWEVKPEFKDLDVMDCVEKEEPVYEWECPESLLSEVEG